MGRMLSRYASRSDRTLVAAPIQVYGVSGSYAAAAYSAAVTSGQKEAVSADLAMLSTVFEKDSIESYFSNPFVAKGDKLAALQSVAGEAGLSETTLNLFGVMAENNRMNLVSEVAEVYARIIQADAGTVPCSVESAIPLTASQQGDVADALQGQEVYRFAQTKRLNKNLRSHLNVQPYLLRC